MPWATKLQAAFQLWRTLREAPFLGGSFIPANKPLALQRGASILPAPFFNPSFYLLAMSQHRSLKNSGGSVGTKRSVLKRGERIKLMKARGQWKEGRLPTGLPKTKSE